MDAFMMLQQERVCQLSPSAPMSLSACSAVLSGTRFLYSQCYIYTHNLHSAETGCESAEKDSRDGAVMPFE